MKLSTVALSLMLSSAITTTVNAAETIHTGGPKGAYHNNFGATLATLLGSNPSEEMYKSGVLPGNQPLYMGYTTQTSKGTGANIESCQADPTDICLGQGDIVATVPGMKIIPTGATECLFAVTNNPGIKAFQTAGRRVPWAIPSPQSGSAATFAKAQEIMGTEYANVVNKDSASKAVDAVANNQAQMAFFVQMPDTQNPIFEKIAKEKLTFLPVVSRDFLRYTDEASGLNPYTIQPDVRVTSGGLFSDSQSVTTTCVDIVVFFQDPATSGLSGNDLRDMQDVQSTLEKAAAANLLVPDVGNWRNLFGDLRAKAKTGGAAALDALEAKIGKL